MSGHQTNLGYCFLTFRTKALSDRFKLLVQDYRFPGSSQKQITVGPAAPPSDLSEQSVVALLRHYSRKNEVFYFDSYGTLAALL